NNHKPSGMRRAALWLLLWGSWHAFVRPAPRGVAAPRRLRRARGAAEEGPRPALGTRTPMGQELETLLEEAKTCAEQRFFGLLQSLAGGGVPGLRSWLQGLGLGSRAWAALVWAEQQGACDLDEVLENSEDLAQALQLSGEELAAFLSQNATSHAESQPRGLLGAEHEELMRFLLREGRSNAAVEAFTNFDARLSAAGTGLSREKIEGLEALLASEVQERFKGDLQYLRAMRRYYGCLFPSLPSLDEG
ncbi:unnamed protein product, partial [Effrenium voratum]